MTGPEPLGALRELALDLRWTWSHEADDLWSSIDPEAWEQWHNPWLMLQSPLVSNLDARPDFSGLTDQLRGLSDLRDAYNRRTTWFERTRTGDAMGAVAFFSMEFGLGAALPLYAGGLGVLAGDFLKGASDLGVPMVGVGLLYQQGYFRQILDRAAGQRESYPFNNPADMPIEPALVDGDWLHVSVQLPGRRLSLRVWRATVGRNTLYLLDGNVPLNSAADRGVTAKLYDDDPEVRLIQELALGVGGWRALEALNLNIEVCHINEGHGAFAAIERASSLARRSDLSFQEALWATRVGNIFTTHTPVASGFDRFAPDLVERFLPAFCSGSATVGPTRDEVLALGRADPEAASEPFNTAYAAMRCSTSVFAVSERHETVSKAIFQPLFPRWPRDEVPVAHITNGIHTPTWDSQQADQVWTLACGKERWRDPASDVAESVSAISDQDIWTMRGRSRADLLAHVRRRLKGQLAARGDGDGSLPDLDQVLDPNILTLGFARRFTEYKRTNLLLRDPDRLARILLDDRRPAQIVLAGKAHPADMAGKQMIREWIAFADQPRLRQRVVFLEEYDLGLAQELVQGVDVWLNFPRAPWEACGTSGMKVLVNGGLNCSVLDGWWAEAYQPDLGWAIGGATSQGGEEDIDSGQAEEAYRLLEQAIAPEFYERDAAGVPSAWVGRIRRSMSALTERFSAARMLRDYVGRAYAPACAALRERAADHWTLARALSLWSRRVREHNGEVHIGQPSLSLEAGVLRAAVPVFLGALSPDDVAVELFADGAANAPPALFALAVQAAIPGSTNGYVYGGVNPTGRPADDFTVRIRSHRPGASVPAEQAVIVWQR